MLQQTLSRQQRRRTTTALVGLGAVALVVPVLATSPASAVPSVATRPTVVSAPAAAPAKNHVHARAGRSGSTLGTIYVAVSVSSSDPAVSGQRHAVVQRWRSGAWRTVGSVLIKDMDGPPATLKWRSSKAATLRVRVPSLRLVSPSMKVPAAPSSPWSRYYVRKSRTGDGGAILRVFQDGTAYGINHADLEYSCLAGRLNSPWLTLRSFDFGGWRVKYRTAGTWKRLRINDGYSAVGGPRKSLKGTHKKYFGFCAAPTYASVSTDPNAV
jgi:hypothetical protein